MRRSSRCRSSCAHGSPRESEPPGVGPGALLRANRFSIMTAPRVGQPDQPAQSTDTEAFPVRGEMAEWSKAHPC